MAVSHDAVNVKAPTGESRFWSLRVDPRLQTGPGGYRFQFDAANRCRRRGIGLGHRRQEQIFAAAWMEYPMKGPMKTLAIALAGATALALPSAANATLTITAPTTVTVSTSNQVSSIEWRIDFTDTNTDSPFSDTVSWNNDVAGEYWFRVITNASVANGPDDVDITAAFITG